MRVRINGVQIGFEDIGQGPVVLFIHDYLLDRQMWRPQVDPLVAARYQIMVMCMLFGSSGISAACYLSWVRSRAE